MIGIIGCGNMGAGFAEGLSCVRYDCSKVCLYDHHPEKLEALRKINKDFVICGSEKELIEKSEIIVCAISYAACQECMKKMFRLPSTVMAVVMFNPEISLSDMYAKYFIRNACKVIPNMAIKRGKSVSQIVFGSQCELSVRAQIKQIFELVGRVIVIDESQCKAATIIASCQHALLLKYVQAVKEAGIKIGLTRR